MIIINPGSDFPLVSLRTLHQRTLRVILGSTFRQRLCQRGLFRRGPMTDRDVAGVFRAIQAVASGRERTAEAREKRKAGETQTRQSGEKRGETVGGGGGGGGAGNALADSSGAS